MPERTTYRPVDLDKLSLLIGERIGIEVSQMKHPSDTSAREALYYFAGVFQGISATFDYEDGPAVSYEIDLHNHETPIRIEWDETFVISHYS